MTNNDAGDSMSRPAQLHIVVNRCQPDRSFGRPLWPGFTVCDFVCGSPSHGVFSWRQKCRKTKESGHISAAFSRHQRGQGHQPGDL